MNNKYIASVLLALVMTNTSLAYPRINKTLLKKDDITKSVFSGTWKGFCEGSRMEAKIDILDNYAVDIDGPMNATGKALVNAVSTDSYTNKTWHIQGIKKATWNADRNSLIIDSAETVTIQNEEEAVGENKPLVTTLASTTLTVKNNQLILEETSREFEKITDPGTTEHYTCSLSKVS